MIIHKTFEHLNVIRLLNVLFRFNLRPVSKSFVTVYVVTNKLFVKFNPFHPTGLFLYLQKTENQTSFNVFREYGKRPVAWGNEAIVIDTSHF